MNPLVSKSRKPKFELFLKLIDLNNVPLTTGTSFIKWHLPTSTSTGSEHRGHTPSSPIKDHKVIWDYTRMIPLRLTIDKNNNLLECPIHFEIIQEYPSGAAGRTERVTLGQITLNLAEYVEESEVQNEDEEGVVRRYLLQDSKINSTVKIGIGMRQVEGERNFTAPALRSAPVFGGIAGIMKGDNGGEEGGETGHLPNPTPTSEKSELHDMYRRALAASWQAGLGEMPADECVEDIFAGGDGWKREDSNLGSGVPPTPTIIQGLGGLSAQGSGEDLRQGGSAGGFGQRVGSGRHRRNGSEASTVSDIMGVGKVRGHKHKKSGDARTVSGGGAGWERGSAWDRSSVAASSNNGSPPRSSHSRDHDTDEMERGRSGYKHVREVDEFDAREDLVAWSITSVGV